MYITISVYYNYYNYIIFIQVNKLTRSLKGLFNVPCSKNLDQSSIILFWILV